MFLCQVSKLSREKIKKVFKNLNKVATSFMRDSVQHFLFCISEPEKSKLNARAKLEEWDLLSNSTIKVRKTVNRRFTSSMCVFRRECQADLVQRIWTIL